MDKADLDPFIDDDLLEFDGDTITFKFDDRAAKMRVVSDGKKKAIAWAPGLNPPFWPVPHNPGPEITITEGEFDAIVLIHSGEKAYSITGGAGSPPDLAAFKALADMGVERIRVLFDEDEAGRKGREVVTQRIRDAGIIAVNGRVVGLEPLFDEKDARDVAVRTGTKVVVEDAIDEDGAIPLSTVPSVPPAQLLLNYIHPAEHSILYGDGGTGKGVIVADWCATLIRDDKKILIVDYEMHAQHEWRPRIQQFLETNGKLPSEVSRLATHVFIVQPSLPVWDISAWLHDEALRVGADLVVIDSATYACVPEEAEKSVTALKYSKAIATIGRPVLTIAHVTKSDMNPAAPFGSTYWKNGARVITAVSRTGTDPLAPRLLKNWKSNQRGEFKDQHVDWTWLTQDLPPTGGLTYEDVKPAALTGVKLYTDSVDRLISILGRDPTPQEIADDTEHDLNWVAQNKFRWEQGQLKKTSNGNGQTTIQLPKGK